MAHNRRELIIATLGVPVATAGCGGDSESPEPATETTEASTPTPTPTPTDSPTPTPEPTPTPTPPGTADAVLASSAEQPGGSPDVLPDVSAAMTREGENTTYEVLFPWSTLPISTEDTEISLSLVVNDNDGDQRKGWVEWGSGIGRGKDPSQFNLAVLVDEETEVPEDAYAVRQYSEAIDGELSTGDIPSPAIDLEEAGSTQSTAGDVTVSGTVWIAWNEDGLYFAADLEDDTHHQPYQATETWRGDGFQLGVAAGAPGDSLTYHELNVGGNPS